MLLVDHQIRQLCTHNYLGSPTWKPMIEPFSESVSGGGVISYGLDHAGYCLRLGGQVMVFKNSYGEEVDPKRFADPEYRSRVFDIISFPTPTRVLIPAHGYVLGTSLEYIRMPRSLKGHCVGKSTLARCGILINTTPIEPEWEGHLTIEISNSNPCPAAVYVGEGIAQLEFEMLAEEPETSYKDKGGVYQGQVGVTPAIVR